MTGLLGVAVYCVAVVALVLALARFAEWSVSFWEDDPQTPAWLRVGWHRWRFHTLTRTANGDVVCWTCTRPLVWARRSESWAWTDDFEEGEPDPESVDPRAEAARQAEEFAAAKRRVGSNLDREHDLELHVAEAMRVANEDDR